MKTKNTWIRAYNFTKSKIDSDWQFGVSEWAKIRDCITDDFIPKLSAVFWNRSKGNICVSLDNYKKVVEGSDISLKEKLMNVGLPLDLKI